MYREPFFYLHTSALHKTLKNRLKLPGFLLPTVLAEVDGKRRGFVHKKFYLFDKFALSLVQEYIRAADLHHIGYGAHDDRFPARGIFKKFIGEGDVCPLGG